MWNDLLRTLEKKLEQKLEQKQKQPPKKLIINKQPQRNIMQQQINKQKKQDFYRGKKAQDNNQDKQQLQIKNKKKKYVQKKKFQDNNSQSSTISESKSQFQSRLNYNQNSYEKINQTNFNNKKKTYTIHQLYTNDEIQLIDQFQQQPKQNYNRKFDHKRQQKIKPQMKKYQSGNTYKKNQNKFQPERSRTVNNFNQKYFEKQYENKCFKLMKYKQTYQKLDENQQQLELQIRKIKKLIFETEMVRSYQQKPKQITVYKSLQFPTIFIGYEYKDQKRYMNLSQINRAQSIKKKTVEYHNIIKKIYDMHYYPVQFTFQQDLIEFIKIKTTQKKIQLSLKKKYRGNDQKQIQNLFYYCLNKKEQIQLSFFDQNMKQILISQQFIKQNKNKLKKEFQTFQNFIKSIKNTNDNEAVNFGQQQVQSDQQIKTNFNQTKNITLQIKKTQQRIKQLLSNDISQLQQTLQTKNDELHQLMSKNVNDEIHIQKLGEEVDDLNRNIQNFKNTKEEIQIKIQQIKKLSPEQYLIKLKMCLKRMIMASKQLSSKLPILGKKKQLFELLQKHKLIILEGETGSGKSTQLPQLLCQFYSLFENPNAKPVLITQPRKIATRSLAQRVSEQLQQPRGAFVDYVTTASKQANPKAKILFKLDRLVLDELVISPTLQNYSCLVIDEAHERTISIDVILGLVKKLLQSRNDFKVIITSASMQISLFQKYFKSIHSKTLKVSGRLFPVDIRYIDQSKQDDTVKKIQKTIDYQLLTDKMHLKEQYKGHILVFCSDTLQIQRLTDIYQKKLNKLLFKVLPLHGKLTPQDQKKVFQKTKEYKLIFASRIAETAITIDGVKVVIDPGNDRQMIYDQKTKFSTMKMKLISKSSAKQRAGRAGRTQQGYCFRIYNKVDFQKRDMNKLPQIKAIALQTLILRLKTLKINNVFNFDYIQPPQKQGMQSSIETLKMIGCLDEKQNITAIGNFLVQIPIQPFLARAIIEGILMQKTLQLDKKLDQKFKNLTEGIIQIICMVLNASNMFRIPQNYRQKGQFVKYKQFSHEKGDFFFLKNIYDQYKIILYHDRRQLKNWIHENFLIGKTLNQVKDLIHQISGIIRKFKVDQKLMKNQITQCKVKLKDYKNYEQRVLSCLTTSFCANLCLYSGNAFIGYTFMNQKKTMAIYGTSCLSLLGICPKWILAYDFYEGKQGKLYCKVANEITFKFLQDTVNEYIYKKFNIQNCQHANPFYKEIKYDVQTLILCKIKNLYRMRDLKRQAQFMKNIDINFNEQQNRMSIFLRCDQKLKQKSQTQKKFEKQIQNIQKILSDDYKHNYIGNIFVKLGNGLIVKEIQFLNTQTVFEITNMDIQVFDLLYENFVYGNKLQTYGKDKIKYFPDGDDDIQLFQKFIDFLTNGLNKKFNCRRQLVDTRKKIPQTKIYLHWYAGISQKANVLLSYQNQDITEENLKYIEEAIQNLMRQRNRRGERNRVINQLGKLGLTKNKKGINVWRTKFDQIQVRNYLLNLIKNKQISVSFKLPKGIRMFRQPQRPYCAWSDLQWQEKINQIIQKIGSKKQNCLRIWGYKFYNNRNQKNQKISDLQKTYRVQMKAQIKTFDLNLLKKLQNQYDGKRGILGCQKIHISSMFDQKIAVVDKKVFENLWDEYIYNVQLFKQEFPTIFFEYIQRKQKRNSNKTKILVIVRGENRDDLIKPMRVLGELFSPKYISLTDVQFRYLNTDQGGDILYRLQEQFQYKIYFGFDRYQRKLKLYCHDSLLLLINDRLKQYLKISNFHFEVISYKGKNLKRIQKIIKNQNNNLKLIPISPDHYRYIAHEIKFATRQIVLHGDIQTFNKVKRLINQVKQQKLNDKQCQICSDEMITPYKLYNCKHSFCWACLASMIRQFKQSNEKQLKCCYYYQNQKKYCNNQININDVATVLSEQQLQKICDIKISKYVESNNRYIFCKSPNCEQIFDRNDIGRDNSLDCQLCGRVYCLKCGASHKNYTCQEWKDSQNIDDKKLKQLGIKKCPNCGNGIQKNQGCNHIQCKCNAHICWKCFQYFKEQKECYDHLSKVCGGIFDDNAQ